MTPEEYNDALEAERKARNDRTQYVVTEEPGDFLLARRNGARQSWGVAPYTSRETAQLAADETECPRSHGDLDSYPCEECGADV